MEDIDPQQELFTALLLALQNKFGEENVYDGCLPPDGTPYPFVYLAESDLIDEKRKGALLGEVTQTINAWHNNPHERGTVSSILLDIKTICRQLEHTANFDFMVTNINQRILPDTTTAQPLLHGVLEVGFKFA